ncbi:MAG: STAS domain-containing protein [Planctomycetes bacterium]|nr:STAS domain-containing protein [Planctomycetota bacterium]
MTRVEIHDDYGSLADISLDELRATLLKEAASCRNGPLVLEVSKVRYVGAAFLGVLIEVASGIRSRGWQMALVNVGPGMSKLFQVTKTENWFAEDRMN